MGTGAIKRIDDKKYRVRKCLIENHKGESRWERERERERER